MGYDTGDNSILVRTDEVKHIITDVVSPNLTYVGRTFCGQGQTMPVWQIKRMITSGNITEVDFANKGTYDQIWTNRANLFPSFFQNNISLSFDGVVDYAFVSTNSRIDFSNTSAFSYSFWTKLTDGGANTFLYKRSNNANLRGYSITKTAGSELVITLQNAVGNAIQVTTSGANINNGSWNNVVMTYDGTSLASGVKVYVNGVSVTLTTNSNTLSATISNTADLFVGATNPGNVANINAKIDELSLWRKSLSASDVSSIFNNGHPGDLSQHVAISQLVMWHRMGDGDTYPIIKDQADNSDLTMVNMTIYNFSSDAP